MKNLIHLTAIAALAASGLTNAQTAAYSKPSGYMTQTLSQGFNLIGLTLQNSPAASGTSTTVTSTTLSSSSSDFTASLAPGAKYLLEITSGAKPGLVVEVSTWTATTLNLVDDLTSVGVIAGDTFNLRKAPTLEEIFGTTTSVLTKSNNSALADIVYIPQGNGAYSRYFLNNSSVWRNALGGAAPSIPVTYLDGIFVEKKNAGDVSLVMTGQVKTTATVIGLSAGFNLIGNPYPAGATLQNSGLADSLGRSNNSALADIVYIPTANGAYDRFFVNNTGVWRNALGGAAPADHPLTSAMFIERKGATGLEVTRTAPDTYSNL